MRKQGNLITVRIDGSENMAIPPFGGQIDYLTYAGVYRDVWLKIADSISIARLKVETHNVLEPRKTAAVGCDLANPRNVPIRGTVTARISREDGAIVAEAIVAAAELTTRVVFDGLEGLSLWDVDDPVTYNMTVELRSENGADSLSATFGFRTAVFTPSGFVLNGRKLKLRGLNRHQSYPYVGYAMGRSAQERDAEILKRTLKCNLVRTSHYPQSPWFLDHCDRIGLLVFEEIPGWQHIGDEAWRQGAVANVRRMIERDWNHPSIVLWGVRINESKDAHDFYVETSGTCSGTRFTSARQTGGVRYLVESRTSRRRLHHERLHPRQRRIVAHKSSSHRFALAKGEHGLGE